MIGVLIVTHGDLAKELLLAGVKIDKGLDQQTRALSFDWDTDGAKAQKEIAQALKELDKGDGVLVLSDMFGGTPMNLSLGLLNSTNAELVSGVNLSMVVHLAKLRQNSGLTLKALAREVAEKGRGSICVVSDTMGSPSKHDDKVAKDS